MSVRWARSDAGWIATAGDAAAMRAVGAALAALVEPGDVVVLDGPLGAGKTTLVQGMAAALEVRGAVTSPTFVIARRHPGPRFALVHVDAYRVGTTLEIDDLDLDADIADSVTVVEWGVGKVEGLGEAHLEVVLDRSEPAPADEGAAAGEDAPAAGAGVTTDVDQADDDDPAAGPRRVTVRGVGARWAGLRLPPHP